MYAGNCRWKVEINRVKYISKVYRASEISRLGHVSYVETRGPTKIIFTRELIELRLLPW